MTPATPRGLSQTLSQTGSLLTRMNMIPTVAKKKLPSFLAYPTGAEVISEALAGIPQLDEMSLWFSRHDYGRGEIDGKLIVIVARYTKHNMGLSAAHYLHESGYYGPRWDTTVYAVPKSLNARVRDALRSHGFSVLLDWLSQPRAETWLSTSHRLSLLYCDERAVILADES